MCLKVAHSFSSSHRVSSWVFTLSGAVPAGCVQAMPVGPERGLLPENRKGNILNVP